MLRFVIALMLATPAVADTADAFRAGRWAEAAREGRTENTAASRLLAGRAQLWLAGYETPDKARAVALVEAAEADFDAALARAPDDPELRLQKAVAIGYRAKLSKSPGLAKDARDRFLAVRAAHPDMALAWSALAGWHGGSVATLGRLTAGLVLGAKTSEFEAGSTRALALAPRNPAYRTLYAQGLMDLSPGNAARAADVLANIDKLPVADAFESRLRAQGTALAKTLAERRPAEAQKLARRQSAFGGLK